jgi:acyl carrier protein
MYVGGAGLSRGYLNQPRLTAECFLPNPFSRQPGARFYRTGDLARYLPDGQIEFLGRADDQVKIRGFRIELGEVEIALGQHENVREAMVVARPAPGNGHMQLVAYVVPRTESDVTSGALRRHLEQQLPDHMIPAAFVLIPQLPRTPSGKLDRRSLPASEMNQTSSEALFVAPQTEMERILAAVWQEVLNTDKAGINESFFELGGDSLLLLRANAKLREALNREISIVEMFEYPTISSLAAYLSEQEREDALKRGRSRAEIRRTLSRQQKQHLARATGESSEHSSVI